MQNNRNISFEHEHLKKIYNTLINWHQNHILKTLNIQNA